ncbi:MAG: hypothetical protein ABR587_04145 [Candidatus Binatia bacterium]
MLSLEVSEIQVEATKSPLPRPIVSAQCTMPALPPSRRELAERAIELCGTRLLDGEMLPAMGRDAAARPAPTRLPTVKPPVSSGSAKWATGIPPLPPVPRERLKAACEDRPAVAAGEAR